MSVYVDTCDLGRGLFAARRYQLGEAILVFGGALIDCDAALAKGAAESDVLQIGPNLYIDLVEPFRCINHSCRPNAGIVNGVVLIALRPIDAGEEIRFDYSTTIGDGWKMPCACRSPGCRRTVEAFDRLPVTLQQRYLAMGIVEPYLWPKQESGNGQGRPEKAPSGPPPDSDAGNPRAPAPNQPLRIG